MEPKITQQTPVSLEHPGLRRGNPAWIKGVSGNPKGSPKKAVCITSWLKEYAGQNINKPIDIKKLTYAQAAALNMWKEAVKGDLQKYEFIVNRIEGKVKEPIDITMRNDNVENLTTTELMAIASRGRSPGNIAPSVSPISSN